MLFILFMCLISCSGIDSVLLYFNLQPYSKNEIIMLDNRNIRNRRVENEPELSFMTKKRDGFKKFGKQYITTHQLQVCILMIRILFMLKNMDIDNSYFFLRLRLKITKHIRNRRGNHIICKIRQDCKLLHQPLLT